MSDKKVSLSVLNLIPRFEDESGKEALDRSVELAKAVEELGYERYWVAEHHNFKGVMSSATDLVMQHILQNTDKIKVGSGGIMLPNHTTLQVAESFGTLETLYPDRVDLGLGRAPGTDPKTARILYRPASSQGEVFFDDIKQLITYFGSEGVQGEVKAYPGLGLNVPLYILGSSSTSAHIAAALGLPYAYAAHINPNGVSQALAIYRSEFRPSEQLKEPYVIVSVLAVAAETKEKAEYWYSSTRQVSLRMFNGGGQTGEVPKPVENYEQQLTSAEKILLQAMMGERLMGDPEAIKRQWESFQSKYGVDELMALSYIHDLDALVDSYRLLKEVITEN